MEVIWNNNELDPSILKNPVVTIGNFDGCHIGHQQIFQRARAHASRIGGVTVVYTFDPHPASIIKGVTPQLIFTLEEKIEAIRCQDMDVLVIAPFTREFADTDPEVFVKETILEKIGVQGVVVGLGLATVIPTLDSGIKKKRRVLNRLAACTGKEEERAARETWSGPRGRTGRWV